MTDPNPILVIQAIDFCSVAQIDIGYGYIVLFAEAWLRGKIKMD